MFMERAFDLLKDNGYNAQVNMQSWMFLSSYQTMRENLLDKHTFITMAHLGARAFGQISGEVVQTTAFILAKKPISSYRPTFFRLIEGNEEQKQTALLSGKNRFDKTVQEDFKKIPGSPVAYWVNPKIRDIFKLTELTGDISETAVGLFTCDNARFLRAWHEIDISKIGFSITSRENAMKIEKKYFPYNKGGGFCRWYGLNELVVQFDSDGQEIREYREKSGQSYSLPGERFYFKKGITWSGLTSSINSFRYSEDGFIFESNKGQMLFSDDDFLTLGSLNSVITEKIISLINPTISLQSNEIKKIPRLKSNSPEIITKNVSCLVGCYKKDWDSRETSWDFTENPLIRQKQPTLKAAFEQWQMQNRFAIEEMKRLEEGNNRLFIEAYGLQDELSSDVPEEQITLGRADREKDIQRLISYAIGCMMGRYSLDAEGLIYAHAGNIDFDPAHYPTFAADDDGIIPLTDQDWFKDDATNRFRDFIRTVWGEESLQENLSFVAESLCLGALTAKRGEQSLETIRRYLSNQFYKDHLKTYKKHPIYWLFSSGKQKAFEGLVYLHRYNDSTLPRMRTEYVTPLLGKYDAYADQLKKQLEDATTSEATLLKKELLALEKKQTELRAFDDNLKHYADRRIKLDLDDGVKVNYGKFGDLLAEVKAVTGSKE